MPALAVGLFRTDRVWVGADGTTGADDVTGGRQPPCFGLSSPVGNGGVVPVGLVGGTRSVLPFSIK